jgi:hypothetical protein
MTKPVKPDQALVQTWVPRPVHAWVRREAERAGRSVASWLRQHLVELRRAEKGQGE